MILPTQRSLSLLALAAASALALTACGGSSSPPAQTITVAVVPAPQRTSQNTTAINPTKTTTAAKRAVAPVSRGHHKYGPGVGTNEGGTARVITHLPVTLPPGVTVKQSVSIAGCLRNSGLVKAGMVRSGVWAASDPVTFKMVFVDGPYRTTASADASVKTLKGLEAAARGGLYVVSTGVANHLSAAVHSTAACLNQLPGGGAKAASHGSLHF